MHARCAHPACIFLSKGTIQITVLHLFQNVTNKRLMFISLLSVWNRPGTGLLLSLAC